MVGRSEEGTSLADEGIAHEQAVVTALYDRLDEQRRHTEAALQRVRRQRAAGTAQNRSERDAFAALHEERLRTLRAVEDRLCFGRLDLRGGVRRYIGRIGLSDEAQRQLLVDWRAPAAQEFYQATAASPGDVLLRRHIATRGREVVGLEDELLDPEAVARGDLGRDAGLQLNGEGALMAALAEHRTGRMRDIVGTIQAEQDRIIRAPLPGVLVVQGGPGTGKTAVALHRAAYLLYTHRERIARSGVLVVGPTPVFLRYIEQVLPALGESGVVMVTPGQLLPGLDARGEEDPRAAALKGDVRMARVVARALAARQRVPRSPRRLDVDGTVITLQPSVVEGARARARRSRKPHNLAREQFVKEVLDALVAQLARALRMELHEDNRAQLLADLRDAKDVRREVNLCWMPLTPQRLVADLWADPSALAAAAPYLSAHDRALLHRERTAPWTPADVPLLDEAAELLGEDDSAQRLEQRRRAVEREAELRYARGALQLSGAGGMVTAEMLADRFTDAGPSLTLAERAAGDRTWTYGHVVVDEAQELSPMAWRVLLRRCPSKSMTVVGDTAQTAALEGVDTWADVLDRVVPGRWRLEELTVNYRTPAEVMAVAAAVLTAAGVPARPPRPARTGQPPVLRRLRLDPSSVCAVMREEVERAAGGRVALLLPREGYGSLAREVVAALPAEWTSAGGVSLTAPVTVIEVGAAKGLEFDVVVLVEPVEVLEQSARGANDLYVALTRPTQRLVVLHQRELPAGMGVAADQLSEPLGA